MLTVQATQVPPYNYGLITPIWIAFAGHCYWSTSPENFAKPLFYFNEPAYRSILDTEQFLDDIKVRQVIRRHAQGNSLIEEMVEFRSGVRYFHDGKELLSEPLPTPYSIETTNAFFQASSWTNISNVEFPTKFILTKYLPDFKNSATPRLLKQAEWVGEVKSVTRTNCTGGFLPTIPDSVRVTDYRMPVEETRVAAIIYDSDSQRVLDVSEVRQLDVFERKVNKRRSINPEALRKVFVLLVLLALIPIAVFFNFFRTRNTGDG